MRIAINRAHYPVTVLGHGKRIGIWLQGCSLHCEGCISRDTWDRDPSSEIELEILLDWCNQVAYPGLDGITITGGEPFDQPEALAFLIDGLRSRFVSLAERLDILCYTGYSYKKLQRKHANLLSRLDVVIAGPYREAFPAMPLRGSSNQEIVCLSDLGVKRYGDMSSRLTPDKRIQMVTGERAIWFIGIPEQGEMEQLAELCKAQGIIFNDTSWRV